LDLKYSKFGMDKSMLEFIDSAEKRKVIRVKDLHGMVMKKDKTSNGLGNAIILDMQKVATDMIKTVDENGKKSEKYEHADFSRLQTQTFKKFEKIFLSPDANIRYLATQPQVIGYGDSERTYKDDKQKDLNLNKVIVDQMGLGSDILTLADVNTDGSIDKLDSDPAVLKEYGIELSKHNEAKAMIIEKLTNPQTESERKVAAKELANYWTRHAKAEFIYNRELVEGDESTVNGAAETTETTKTTKELVYVKNSRLKAESIDKLISGKITLQGVKDIAIKLGPKATYKMDGDIIQVLDSQGFVIEKIDPNKPVEARTALYNLAEVREEHRDDQIMGVAKNAPEEVKYTTFDPTK